MNKEMVKILPVEQLLSPFSLGKVQFTHAIANNVGGSDGGSSSPCGTSFPTSRFLNCAPHTDYNWLVAADKHTTPPAIFFTQLCHPCAFTATIKLTPPYISQRIRNEAALYLYESQTSWLRLAFGYDGKGYTPQVSLTQSGESLKTLATAPLNATSAWLRITADKEKLVCYYSADGKTWQQAGILENNYTQELWLGISCERSDSQPLPVSATFYNLSLEYHNERH